MTAPAVPVLSTDSNTFRVVEQHFDAAQNIRYMLVEMPKQYLIVEQRDDGYSDVALHEAQHLQLCADGKLRGVERTGIFLSPKQGSAILFKATRTLQDTVEEATMKKMVSLARFLAEKIHRYGGTPQRDTLTTPVEEPLLVQPLPQASPRIKVHSAAPSTNVEWADAMAAMGIRPSGLSEFSQARQA